MSLLSAIILPQLEKELISLEPVIAQFVINQLHKVGADVVAWAESKLRLHQETKPNE